MVGETDVLATAQGTTLVYRDGGFWIARLDNGRIMEVWGPTGYLVPDEYRLTIEETIP